MGRLIFFAFVGLIGFIVVVAKNATGKVTGNQDLKNVTIQGETKKVMDKTAKGISWMEAQWEESKKEAEGTKKNKVMID